MLDYAPTRLLGKTTPRIFTPPLVSGRPGPCGCGCALTPATSLGFSAVEFATEVVGIRPLPWQRWLLIHALELRPDGQFRFRNVLVLVARQNGKTSLVELKNLYKMYVLAVPLVIGTAQDLDTAEESWDKAVEIAEGTPELAAEVRAVDKTNGKKSLKLANGSRWKIKAASRRGGRGLSGDDVNLDELREHQNWLAWGAVTKTTLARANAQIWSYSNAGDDKSVVLNELVEKGRAGAENPTVDAGFGFFEWSAPDGVKCTCGRPDNVHTAGCRLQDRTAWAQANPSLGYTITEDAIASALSTDPEPVFRTEVLCQRVERLSEEWAVIPEDKWRALADPEVRDESGNLVHLGSEPVGRVAFGVHVAPDRSWAAIGVAGRRADGLTHVELVDYRPDTAWVAGRLVVLRDRWDPCAIVVDAGSPAGSLIAGLQAAGLELLTPTTREVGHAFGQFVDAVTPKEGEPTLRYLPDAALDVAVAGAATRDLGGARAWDSKASPVDICPLVAVTFAAWGYATRGHIEEPEPVAPFVLFS